MSKAETQTLGKVLKDFEASWEYCSGSWHDRWTDNYKLYNNNRVKIGYEGITDTFVPMTFSTVETMTSGLFGGKPKFDFIPPQEKRDQKTDILNALLDYYWDKDQWNIKVINWGRDMLRYGTSVIYLYWKGDHPCMINVPIRDFFIDPMATCLEDADYMGRRYLTTLDDLKSYEVLDLDAEPDADGNYPMKPKYKNLKQIPLGNSGQGDNTDKQEKDIWYGSTITNPSVNQVECIEYWTKDKVITVANRSTVIEETDNYYKAQAKENGAEYATGFFPFASLRDYVDASLFYAKGEIDFIAEEQELLNDITNQNIDSVTYTLNQMYTLDPRYADRIEEVENLPGAVYPFEAGALVPIPQRPIPPDAFNERMNLKNEIRETTASNEIVKGVGTDSNQTATEINAQIAGAGQRLGLKITQIENEGFHQLARIVFNMVRLYVNEPMMVRIMGRDGANWEEFDPEEFKGDYEPRVQLEATVQGQKNQDAAQVKEMLAAFLGDPEINQTELKKMVLAKAFDLDPDEVSALIAPVEPLPEELPMEDMGELPPEMPMEQPIEQLPPEVEPTPEELAILEEMIASGQL